jgi:tetratricopeptide (TPR) repeat protein
MNTLSRLFQPGALCAAGLFLLAARTDGWSQATNDPAAARPDEASLKAMERSFLRVQEQMHADHLAAIEKIRQEYQDASKAQVSAINEKLTTIQSALDAERQRRQEEAQRSNFTLLWVSSAFGGVGLMAILLTTLFQWRSVNRMAALTAVHPQLAVSAPQGLLPAETGGLPGKAVELSNQRLMSVIERLERRVFELEHMSPAPRPGSGSGPVTVDAETIPAAGEAGHVGRITVLLGKGQSLLNADKAEDALVCYDEILKLEANHPEALVKKGAALERLKQDDEALRCYDRAIAADGSLTIAYLYKGGVYNRLERYDEALECYEQALRAQGGAN